IRLADDQERDIAHSCAQSRASGQEISKTFANGCQPPDESNHQRALGDPQALPGLLPVLIAETVRIKLRQVDTIAKVTSLIGRTDPLAHRRRNVSVILG